MYMYTYIYIYIYIYIYQWGLAEAEYVQHESSEGEDSSSDGPMLKFLRERLGSYRKKCSNSKTLIE